MQINSAGSTNINLLQSDQFTFRNEDYVVDADGAFMYGQTVSGLLNYNQAQLWNPVGSGITVLLDEIHLTIGAGAVIQFQQYNVALTTLAGEWYSKKEYLTQGNAQFRSDASGAAAGILMAIYRLQIEQLYTFKFQYPWMIPEGRGFHVAHINAGAGPLDISFQGREV